jgi:alpha-1,3-glucan synthase
MFRWDRLRWGANRIVSPQGLYLAGSPHINLPWGSDGYSPLDLTLLDRHFGNIDDWRAFITDAHRRGMYVVLENTMAT